MKTTIRIALLCLLALPLAALAQFRVATGEVGHDAAPSDYTLPAPDGTGMLAATFSYAYAKDSYVTPSAMRFVLQKDLSTGYLYLATFLGGTPVPLDEAPLVAREDQKLTQEFLAYSLAPGKYRLLGLEGPALETCRTFASGTPMQHSRRIVAGLEQPVEFEITAGKITYLDQLLITMSLGSGSNLCGSLRYSFGLLVYLATQSVPDPPLSVPATLARAQRPADAQRLRERYPNISLETVGYPAGSQAAAAPAPEK